MPDVTSFDRRTSCRLAPDGISFRAGIGAYGEGCCCGLGPDVISSSAAIGACDEGACGGLAPDVVRRTQEGMASTPGG